MQRSVTVLSDHPFPELFGELSERILDRISRRSESVTVDAEDVLRDACRDIIRWFVLYKTYIHNIHLN